MTIEFAQARGDAPTASLVFYVPSGIAATLSAGAGTTIGAASASVTAADLGNAVVPLAGSLVVRGPGDTFLSAGAQVPLALAATSCTGSASHAAFWVIVLSAAGQMLEVPIFVDPIAADAAEAPFATAKITVCLPPPDLPAGTPGRAALGAGLLDAALSVKGVFGAGSGEYRWRLRATPYTPASGQPDVAGTVEAQSLLRVPAAITFSAKPIKGRRAANVSGSLTEGGKPVAGVTVKIICKVVLAVVRTDAAGHFAARVSGLAVPKDTLFAQAVAPVRDLGAAGCQPSFPALNFPCVDALVDGFTVTSRKVGVRTR